MNPESVERIVVAETGLEPTAGPERGKPGQKTNDHGPGGGHKTAGRRDGCQSGDRSRTEAQDRRTSADDTFQGAPGEQAGQRTQGGGSEGVGGDLVCRDGAAGIKPIPSEPQHARPHHAQDHAVRLNMFTSKTSARPEQQAECQGAPTRSHVHNNASRKINRPDRGLGVPEPVHPSPNSPHHVGDRKIDDDHPSHTKDQQSTESHPLGDGAHDQCRGDDREHHLIHGEDIVGDPWAVVGIGVGIDSREPRPLETTKPRRPGGKTDRIAKGPPHHPHYTRQSQALRQD